MLGKSTNDIHKWVTKAVVTTKEQLKFYIQADHMMNRGTFKSSLKNRIRNFFAPDYIMKYLRTLRKVEYFSNTGGRLQYFYKAKQQRLGRRLGFSIAKNVFGYGLVIPHWGTIVVGDGNTIGNYAVLHTSICITAGTKKIGDGFYCSTGAKILNSVELGNNVTVGANAVVTRDFEANSLLMGIPAEKKRDADVWYSGEWMRRINECEKLKIQMFPDGDKL